MESFSTSTGIPVPTLKLLISMFSAYPFALFYRLFLLKSSTFIKNIYIFFCSISVTLFFCENDMYHLLLTIVGTFALSFISGPIQPALTFCFNFGYLLYGYWFYSSDNYDINWLLPQCILCLRMIGYGWDIYDGKKKSVGAVGVAKKKSSSSVGDKNAKQSGVPIPNLGFSGDISLKNVPPFSQFLSYALFFPSVLAGPQFSFAHYQRFIEKRELPNATGAVLKYLFLGIFYLAIQQIASSWLTTLAFPSPSFLQNVLLVWIKGKVVLNKYLGVWTLTNGSLAALGISFNGVDYSGMSNIDVVAYETAPSLRTIIASFNINTNTWSKLYIFKRLMFLGNKQVSALLTLAFLATWHGLHPGYYLAFALEFMSVQAEGVMAKMFGGISRSLEKSFVGKSVVWMAGYVWTSCVLYYSAFGFDLLKWHKIKEAYGFVWWYVHVFVGIVLFLGMFGAKKKQKSA